MEDKAGEYPVRVVIRPPNVVPGLAEITVRVQEPVQRVTVLPVFWRAGREGAPPPDEARLVRGETNLYSAELWLMKPGAYSVDVTDRGAARQRHSRGPGELDGDQYAAHVARLTASCCRRWQRSCSSADLGLRERFSVKAVSIRERFRQRKIGGGAAQRWR